MKFADDTVVLGLISCNNEQAYVNQVADLALWCQSNNLALNVSKTKEMVVDFRRKQGSGYTPLTINDEPVERVSSFKYQGVHLTEDLTWNLQTEHLISVSRQQLYFLRWLRRFKVSTSILKTFYSSAVECPHWVYLCLVWKQHCSGASRTAKISAFSRAGCQSVLFFILPYLIFIEYASIAGLHRADCYLLFNFTICVHVTNKALEVVLEQAAMFMLFSLSIWYLQSCT